MGRSEVITDKMILQYLANGYTYADIATYMDLPFTTVRNKVNHLRKNYQASNIPNLVAIAFRMGVIK